MGENGIHLPIPAGPLTAEVPAVMANSTAKGNPDSRIFAKVDVDLFANARTLWAGNGVMVRKPASAAAKKKGGP